MQKSQDVDQLRSGAFSESEKGQIRSAVFEKYRQVAVSAEKLFMYETGKKGAAQLGYDVDVLDSLPAEMLSSYCGVGNPFSLGDLQAGDNILDIGCGAGVDLVYARKLTGEGGRVCGVDITPEMVLCARENMSKAGLDSIEVYSVEEEKLPFDGESFDVVISNGVINLSPAKPEMFSEIFRVLKPGGRLQFADIVLEKELPKNMAGSLEAWSQ